MIRNALESELLAVGLPAELGWTIANEEGLLAFASDDDSWEHICEGENYGDA